MPHRLLPPPAALRALRYLLPGLLLLLVGPAARAQVAAYVFAPINGVALEPSPGGILISSSSTYCNQGSVANIGFSFVFGGTTYTQFRATSGNVLGLGAQASTSCFFPSTSGATITPGNDQNGSTGYNGHVSYALLGSAPNRKLVVEFNTSSQSVTGAADRRYQVWLFETSNALQLVYGGGYTGPAAGSAAAIGIATSNSDYVSVSPHSNASSTSSVLDARGYTFTSGKSYRFEPFVAGTSPTISSFTPTFGGAGTSVTVSGARLNGATAVRVNGTAGTITGTPSSGSLTFTVGAGSSSGRISVSTPGGLAVSSTSFALPASITSFTPTSGITGSSVTITGTELAAVTTVRVNGTAGTITGTPSNTSLTFTVGAGSTTGPLTVTSAAGTGTSSTNYTVTGGLGTITPSSGPVGTSLTINGTGFTGTTSVRFGEVPAKFTVNGAGNQITTTVPRLASSQQIRITNSNGTTVRSGTAYPVTRPSTTVTYSAVTSSLATNGSTSAVPVVTDLDGDDRLDLLIGRADGAISHYEQGAVNGTTFTLVTNSFSGINVGGNAAPALTDLDGDGRLDLVVGRADGTLSYYTQNAVNATAFTLSTNNYEAIDTGDNSAPAFTDLDGDGLLEMLLGKLDGSVGHFQQTSQNGTSFYRVTSNFNSLALGSSSSPKPFVVDLDGDGLLDLLFGKADGSVARYEQSAVNSTTVTLVSSSFAGLAAGTNAAPTLTDVDSDGSLDLLLGRGTGALDRYEQGTAAAVPTLTSLNPTSGPVGQSVTLMGTNFTSGATVSFNGTAAAGVTFSSATSLTATVPTGATTGNVTVTTAGGTSGGVSFTVTGPGPTITSFTPTSGPAGTVVTVTGTNLSTTRSVLLRGVPARFTATGGQVNLTVPPAGSGGPLRLTTPTGTALSSALTVPRASQAVSYVERNANLTNVSGGPQLMAGLAVTDFDNDGLIDLLQGNDNGTLAHYEQSAVNATTLVLRSSTLSGVNTGSYTRPAITDFDGDGLLDLLVGKQDGTVNHYEQTTANGTAFTLVSNAFAGIAAPGGFASPTTTDLDGDGLLDLLVGSQNGPIAHYEQNAANSTAFTLRTAQFQNYDFAPYAFNGSVISAPTVTDLDGNGRLDLVIGFHFSFMVRAEQTAVNSTTFGPLTSLGTPNRGYETPVFTDLDGDGLLDLLIGSSGNSNSGSSGVVGYLEQLATPTITSFTPTSGPVGTSVTITGTNLDGATAARVNGTAGTIVGTPTATSLTFTVGAGSTSGAVSVVTPGGTATGSTFTVTTPLLLTTLSPTRNQRNAAVSTNVALTFNQNINSATAGNVRVWSAQRGGQLVRSGSATVSTSGATVTVNPNTDFRPSEVVQVSVPSAVTSTGGTGAIPHTYQFTAATTAGTGALGAPATLTKANFDRPAVAAGDVNGDGNLDLVAFSSNGSLSRWLGTGSGGFGTRADLSPVTPGGGPIGESTMALADMDGDGDLDVIFSDYNTEANYVLPNNGSGTFANSTVQYVVGASTVRPARYVQAADVNADGVLDLVFPLNSSNELSLQLGPSYAATVYSLGAGNNATYGAVGDVDEDGRLDLLASCDNGVVVVLRSGTSYATPVTYGFGATPKCLRVADFNNDGHLDLVTANEDANSLSVRLGSGTGTFGSASTLPVGSSPGTVVAADLNGDGHLDLASLNRGSSTLSVYLGTGTGTFGTAATYNVGAGLYEGDMVSGDFNNDGRLDLAYTTDTGLQVLLQAQPPTITGINPTSGPVGQSVTITGTNLTGATAAKVGSTAGSSISVNGAGTSLTFTVAAGSTTGTVSVTTPGGTATGGTFTITNANTTTSLTSSTNPSVFGQGITLTATVAVTNPGTGTPSGTVTFKDGAATLGTGTLNGSGVATFSTTALTVGSHSLTAVYGGAAGYNTSTSGTLTQGVNQAATTTGLTSNVNPSVAGQNITLTATVAVSSPGSGTPSGTVTFYDGATSLGTGTLNAGGVATRSTSALTPGSHSLTAVYTASTSYATSTSAVLTQVVNQLSTSTTLASNINPSTAGQSITLTATVAAGTGTPTGTVTFYDGATSLGTGSLAGGQATLSTSALTAGSHSLTATYGGAANYAGSTSAVLTQTVNVAAPTISSLNPTSGPVGQSVTITGTNFTGATAVTFNGTTAGFTVNSGTSITATVPAGATTGGVQVTTAGGPSNAATFTVTNAATTTTLTSSTNPSVFGQSVTLTATVVVSSPGTGSATGTVTFQEGATTLGTGALNASGVATFSTTALTVGSHSLTATYGGATGYNTSTSGILTQTVNQANTTTGLTSNVNPSVAGQSITLTATVAASSPGSGTPAGTVTFKDGATTLGTGTLNGSGVATFSTSSLTVGSHSLTAGYGTSVSYLTSTSAVLTQVVNAAAPAISSLNPTSGMIGASVMITGTSFIGASTVSFNGTAAASFTVNSATQITATVPAGATTGNVTVTTAGGTSNGVTFTVTTAPTALALSPQSVAENVADGTVVGTFTTTDADQSTGFTYALVTGTGSADNGAFTISGDQLLINASPNFEGQSSYAIRVRTTDASGLSFTQTFTVSITNVNEAPATPTDANTAPNTVAENAATGAGVGLTVNATDPDAGATVTYSLTDDAGGRFAVNASTGVVTVANGALLDFEAAASHQITVQASDGTLTSSQSFTIAVTNVNEAPSISPQTFALNENAPNGTTVGTVAASDPDAGATLSYSITAGNTGGAFSFVGSSLRVANTVALDFETTPTFSLTVRVSDGSLNSSATVTVNLNDVAEAPTGIALSPQSLPENQPAGTAVGNLSTTGTGSGYTYTLVSGTGSGGNGAFSISGSQLLTAAAFDFETQAGYAIRVRSTDNANASLFTEQTFTITVTNVNEAPVIADQSRSVVETAAVGAAVGAPVAASEPDGTALTYSITGGNTGGAFAINATTGQLTVAGGLDYETRATYSLLVQVSDGTLTDAATVTVSVTDVNEAPTALMLSNTTVNENAGANAVVGTFSATDPDAGNTFTYTLVSGTGGTDNGLVNISGSSLRITASPDFETKPSYAIRVRVSDQDNLSFVQTFVLTVNDINETPVIADQARSVPETAAIGANVGAPLAATDPDAGTTLTYSILSGNTGGAFSLNAGTGQLTVAAALDAQTTPTYSLTVQVSDGALTDNATITVTVTDVNGAPTAILLSNNTVAENTGANVVVGTMSTTDPDAGDSFTYTLVGGVGATDNGLVSVSGNQLRISASPNFEAKASYAVRVRSTDAGGLFTEQAFTLTITNVNEAPSISDQARSVSEAATVGAAVGAPLVATDVDAGTTLSYSITGGNTGGAFAINAGTGQLTVAAGLDYETTPTYSLTVQVSDGALTDDAFVTISVTNVNEAPGTPTDANVTANTVAENAANNTLVGLTATATDPDAGTTLTYSLTDNAGGRFAINATTGVVRVANGTLLDFETATSHQITVQVSDGSLSSSQTFTIAVTNVNEAPGISPQTFAVDENSANGTTVGTVAATDPDAGTTLSYSITAGNTGGAFSFVGNALRVANTAALDYETTPTFSLTVRVSDGSLNSSATVTVNLNDLNESPTGISLSPQTVAENLPSGTTVGTLSTVGPGSGYTYTLVSGAGSGGNGAFSIVGNELHTAASFNFEAQAGYTIRVRPTDNANAAGFSEQTFTISVSDVNETPNIANQARTVAENTAAGTPVGTALTATDPDGDALTYSITAGNTGGAFAVNATTGQLTVANAAALNYETTTSFSLTVRVTDGTLADVATVTVSVTNVNEAPNISPQAFSVAENSANGTTVGTAAATDPDAGTTLSYSITAGNTGGAFSFVGNSLRVANSAALDYETTPTFNLTVRVSDGSLTDDATVTVNLTDVDDTAPTVTITSPAAPATSTAPIPVTVTFSEAVTGFTAPDVTVTNGAVSSFSGSGTTYALQVAPNAAGTVTISIGANAARDAANNGNDAATPLSITYTVAATATSWTGALSTNWFAAGNWTNGIPTTTLDATIPAIASRYPSIASGAADVRDLTISTGATLTMSGGTLAVQGDWLSSGAFTATGGTVSFTNPSSRQQIGSGNAVAYWNVAIGLRGVQLSGAVQVRRVLTLTGDLVTNGQPLTLLSDAAGTAMVVNDGGVVTGAATVQRYLTPGTAPGLGYRHLSSPVVSTSVNDLRVGNAFVPKVNPAYNPVPTPHVPANRFPNVFGYDETRGSGTDAFDTGYYSPDALTDVLTPGRGYTVYMRPLTPGFVGTLGNADVTVPSLTRTGTITSNEDKPGWHLLGNPYPSAIDWDRLPATDFQPGGPYEGLSGSISVYQSTGANSGGYLTRAGDTGSLPDGLVAMGQGFFTRVTGTGPVDFTFTNALRVTSYENPAHYRAAAGSLPQVSLSLGRPGQALAARLAQAFVNFRPDATAGLDAAYDGPQPGHNTGNVPTLVSLTATGQELAINSLSDANLVTGTTVPLLLNVPAAGTWELTVGELANLDGTAVALLDRLTGTRYDLRVMPKVFFTSDAGVLANRFALEFNLARVTGLTTDHAAPTLAVWPNPAPGSTVRVSLPTGAPATTATVLDGAGRIVRRATLNAEGTLDVVGLPPGVYAVRVGTATARLVIE